MKKQYSLVSAGMPADKSLNVARFKEKVNFVDNWSLPPYVGRQSVVVGTTSLDEYNGKEKFLKRRDIQKNRSFTPLEIQEGPDVEETSDKKKTQAQRKEYLGTIDGSQKAQYFVLTRTGDKLSVAPVDNVYLFKKVYRASYNIETAEKMVVSKKNTTQLHKHYSKLDAESELSTSMFSTAKDMVEEDDEIDFKQKYDDLGGGMDFDEMFDDDAEEDNAILLQIAEADEEKATSNSGKAERESIMNMKKLNKELFELVDEDEEDDEGEMDWETKKSLGLLIPTSAPSAVVKEDAIAEEGDSKKDLKRRAPAGARDSQGQTKKLKSGRMTKKIFEGQLRKFLLARGRVDSKRVLKHFKSFVTSDSAKKIFMKWIQDLCKVEKVNNKTILSLKNDPNARNY
eukprot:TRINITY_DN2375_c0_g1_i2.p1 TRINITY_DN2375_c0_g1~~TRINITY_DN2375_c0_g1_i2.p1  ORF type:complete len:398 (+),score=123.15 TRINITY_DN2375_c0_g1_i2:77-1270(+)